MLPSALLSVHPDRIKIEMTNTTRIANTSSSAAGATSDFNGKALQMVCNTLMERLLAVARVKLNAEQVSIRDEQVWVAETPSALFWNDLIMEAFQQRVNLSEHAHYTTPGIHYDPTIEKGHPFACHVHGTALTGVTVDCVRGTYMID